MDTNHPIPQDVTGFQFRLIGNMTVKQFGYLAAGAILAFLIYYMPIFGLLKLILIPLFSFIGFAFAFIPLEGRPLDAMLGYFISALLAPNQYLYQKSIGHFSFENSFAPAPVHIPVAIQKNRQATLSHSQKQQQLKSYLSQMGHTASTPTDEKEESYLSDILKQAEASSSLLSSFHLPLGKNDQAVPKPVLPPTSHLPQSEVYLRPLDLTQATASPAPAVSSPSPVLVPPPPLTTPSVSTGQPFPIPTAQTEEKEALQKEEKELEKKEQDLKKQEEEEKKHKEEEEKALLAEKERLLKKQEESNQVREESKMTHSKLLELEKSLQDMASQKQSLEQELEKLKSQLSSATLPVQQAFTPTKVKEEPKQKQETQLVRQIPQNQTIQKGLPRTPDFPNILCGVVKDSSGNILPNILIEVKDPEGSPVRAFKTNQLGQFASATPLLNGTYTIDFEDPQGKNKFDTVEIQAKNEIILPLEVISHDLREELRKQLFS